MEGMFRVACALAATAIVLGIIIIVGLFRNYYGYANTGEIQEVQEHMQESFEKLKNNEKTKEEYYYEDNIEKLKPQNIEEIQVEVEENSKIQGVGETQEKDLTQERFEAQVQLETEEEPSVRLEGNYVPFSNQEMEKLMEKGMTKEEVVELYAKLLKKHKDSKTK